MTIAKKINQDFDYLDYNKMFLTFDLGLASSLISLGYELWNLEKSNPKKVQFIFRRAEGIDSIINDYWQNRLKLNARALFENQKMLKNRIYSD
jgi:hypothetical protein